MLQRIQFAKAKSNEVARKEGSAESKSSSRVSKRTRESEEGDDDANDLPPAKESKTESD